MEQKHPHSQDRIQILTTLNENYLPRLQVLLTSIYVTQPEDKADIWLIHSGLTDEALSRIRCQCRLFGFGFYPVMADSSAFTNAPVSTQYPREMYYRLLAAQLLPDSPPHPVPGSGYPGHQFPPPAVGDGPERKSFRCRRAYRKDGAGKQYQPAPPWNKP